MSQRAEFNMVLKESMKSKDQVSISTIRLIIAALKDRDITAKGEGRVDGIEDSEILSMLQSMIKQRRESSVTYRDAGREDLAQREEAEMRVIEQFLPEQLSEEEVENVILSIIRDVNAKDVRDMGKVMAAMKSRYAGQVDMSKCSKVVRDKLL